MPTSADRQRWLVDTSIAIPLVTTEHEQHELVFAAVASRSLGLCGHAAFETYSVLTRLPPPLRRSPATVSRLLAANFPDSEFLSPPRSRAVLESLGERWVAGGSVYDALVAAAAAEHGTTLITRDRQALPTYRDFGVVVEFVG